MYYHFLLPFTFFRKFDNDILIQKRTREQSIALFLAFYIASSYIIIATGYVIT